eukprot:scaffold6999_cov96-Isochrysis_galbana.AAC.4
MYSGLGLGRPDDAELLGECSSQPDANGRRRVALVADGARLEAPRAVGEEPLSGNTEAVEWICRSRARLFEGGSPRSGPLDWAATATASSASAAADEDSEDEPEPPPAHFVPARRGRGRAGHVSRGSVSARGDIWTSSTPAGGGPARRRD